MKRCSGLVAVTKVLNKYIVEKCRPICVNRTIIRRKK